MKTKIVSLIAILTVSFALNAQIDRSKMPKPGPDPVVKLGKAKEFSLKNGLKVILVKNDKLPRASASLTIDNAPFAEGDKAGTSDLMGGLIGRGTPSISKDNFNEKVDFYGANVSFYSTGAYASSLKTYFPEILGLMADAVKNSKFSQEEFDKEVKISLDGIKSGEKSVTNIARRVEGVLIYGANHPFGEFTSKESINAITLKDVQTAFDTYYRPNNAYLIIEGDINVNKTKKIVKKLFNGWKKGSIPRSSNPKPTNVGKTEINFVNMPNAVQSEVVVANNIDLKLGDPDYYAALIANKILGGGGTARLFQNLREDKGYTYGSYSSVRQSRHAATFRASASVRNIVTDSSVVQIQKEINRIRNEKVSADELKNAKEEYIGSFVMDVQKPRTAAGYALNIARYNLPKDFYENYLKNINKVTLEDVQVAAKKYFKVNNSRIIITGKGIDVLGNLEKSEYSIKYFDKEGKLIKKPAMTLPIPDGMTATTVIDKYIAAIGGQEKVAAIKTRVMVANATIQGTPLVMTVKSAGPNKTSQAISVMGNVMQKSVFDGEKGYTMYNGQRKDMSETEVSEAKEKNSLIEDVAFKAGKVVRIEPFDGKQVVVLSFGKTDSFYDLKSGLKVKSEITQKGPDGKEGKIPTLFSDYREVNGVKFPFVVSMKMGPMEMTFEVQEIKINEGVSDEDFK